MRRSVFMLVLAFAAALPSVARAAAPKPKGAFRQLQVGDKWAFITRGIVAQGNRIATYSETRQVGVTPETRRSPDGVECRVIAMQTLTYAFGRRDISDSEAIFTQDQNGTIQIRGRKRSDRPEIQWVVDPKEGGIPDVRSPVSVSDSWTTRYRMSDDSTGQQESRVVGTQRIKLPIGTFDCYVVRSHLEESDGLKVVMLDWYVPELGSQVMTVSLAKTGDGLTFVEAEVMVGSSLARPDSGQAKR